jgi:DNA mismatch repair ATPase MutS
VRAHLLYADRDFNIAAALPPNATALSQDLALDVLYEAMAAGDPFLLDVARKVVLSSVTDLEAIRHRQDALRDCLAHRATVREIYALAVEAIEGEGRHFWRWADHSRVIAPRAVDVLQMLVGILQRLHAIAEAHSDAFKSAGFGKLFGQIRTELGDEYFAEIQGRLRELNFRDGMLIGAELGKGNKGTHYRLLRVAANQGSPRRRMFGRRTPALAINIDPGDEHSAKALSELTGMAMNPVANALGQSADRVISFFRMLRMEMAFYVGCLNLEERLRAKGEPISFPAPSAPGERRLSFTGLYDVCLSLGLEQRVVGNDADGDGKQLIVITGANQGGKSTFLRSVGLAQLMMQSGMFVAAESYRANVCEGVFTHFNREEDAAMKSGKLDEELSRMSAIVDQIRPGCLMLFNDSFAATNEREGSEIAGQIVDAFLERGMKVLFVTHMFAFAQRFHDRRMARALYLQAEREDDGRRTFRLFEREPSRTSFGEDLYDRIFGPSGPS